MLTWLRDNAKIFLIATIVIFVALIFLRWGMGRGSGQPRNPYQRPIATIDGKKIMPEDYQQAIQSVNQQYRSMLENTNNPDPEAMLMLMSQKLSEEAFQSLVDGELQSSFLNKNNWDRFSIAEAEELLIAQISMQDLGDMSARDYLEMVKNDQPGAYQQYLYQTYISGNSMLFPLAVSMNNMVSLDEVLYMERETQAQITARYVMIDASVPTPDEEQMNQYYNDNLDLFVRPSGSVIRYITVQVLPSSEDLDLTLQRLDSLSFASMGNPVASTRAQLADAFGDSLDIQLGQRTEPIRGMYSANPSIEGFHVFLLDSVHQYRDTLTGVLGDHLRDTLFLRNWEVPIFPGYNTVRSMMWDLEEDMETMLARSVPQISDTISIVDFGEISVTENTSISGSVTEELIQFAKDTLWSDSLGPVFFSPSYLGGYPAFTLVKRLQYFSTDTMDYQQALETGTLQDLVQFQLNREAAMERAESIVEAVRSSGINLAAFAEAESLEVHTTPPFTAAQIKTNSESDPSALGGILSSREFGMASLVAPEFQVIGPYAAGSGCVIAEILSRQLPPDNQNTQAIIYMSAQYGHQQLAREHILDNLRESADIRDLREEWTDYYEMVEDSLRAEQEQTEE